MSLTAQQIRVIKIKVPGSPGPRGADGDGALAQQVADGLVSHVENHANPHGTTARQVTLLREAGPALPPSGNDDTALIKAYAAELAAAGLLKGYLPPGNYNTPGLSGLGDVHFRGPGRILGAYNKTGTPDFAYVPAFNDVRPAIHLPRFSTTRSPIVVLVGDSITTLYANQLSEQDSLSRMIEQGLRAQNPHKNITFYNRGLGGTVYGSFVLSPNTGLNLAPANPWQYTWYTDFSKPWIDYVRGLQPDLLIISWGSNETWNMNATAMRSAIATIRQWDKVPDILLMNNTTATPTAGDGADDNVKAYASTVEHRGRDCAAGFIRTFAKAEGFGLLDVNRAEAFMVYGYDPCVFHSERVVGGILGTANAPANVALIPVVLTKPAGYIKTQFEGADGTECRHFAFSASFINIPPNFWGDAPLGATPPWATGQAVAAGATCVWMGRLYTTAAGGNTGAAPPIHTNGTANDGGVDWTLTTFDAPFFVRMSSYWAPGDYPIGFNLCNDLLMWRDPASGHIFWRMRDKRAPEQLFGCWDFLAPPEVNDPNTGLNSFDSGVVAPTAGNIELRVRIANENLLVAIADRIEPRNPETIVINQPISRCGGAFKPAFGYDGPSNGRPTAITLCLDVGRDHLTTPVLKGTDLWGGGTSGLTAMPFGGNVWNHPSSWYREVYEFVFQNADLCGPGYAVAPFIASGGFGVGTSRPQGKFHVKAAVSGVLAPSIKGATQVIEGNPGAVGVSYWTGDNGTVYWVISTPSNVEAGVLSYTPANGRWQMTADTGAGPKVVASFPYPSGSIPWDPPALADGASASVGGVIGGAAVGDIAVASFDQISNANGWIIAAYVVAANTVRVTLLNKTGAAADLPAGTLRITVFPQAH